ncbi:MAG: 50S ribosomal protein L11 methyltransferase [Chloroflexi bacterium]|jgi:ribosomal protein L11 methyltransferase|nr:50S ribosomal protein L11 methyltransferase [Chloroflexota bacterium]
MSWLEVSLTVDGELAEAVADVLARFVPGGVVVESTGIAPDLEGPGYPIGPLKVCGYLPIDAQLEETRQRIEESLYFLGRIQALPEAQFTQIAEINWAEAWKENFHPVNIGERLLIIPGWLDAPHESRIPIRIDPGMAFGTGTHPTTQLCLEFLETSEFSESIRGLEIFDIGCGSGILSIAALKLGAACAFGVDTDTDAITTAEENARINEVGEYAHFARGSVEAIQQGVFPVTQAPLVIANILAHILIQLLDSGMADLIAPGGKLLLSGILEEQMPNMLAALQKHQLEIVAQRQIEDWVALTVKN